MRPRRLTGLWLYRRLRHCDRLRIDLVAHVRLLSLDRGRRCLRCRLVLDHALRLRNLARRGRSGPLDCRYDLIAFRRRRRKREPIRRGRKIQVLLEVIAHGLFLTAARRDNKSGGAYQNKLAICAHRSSFQLHDRSAGPYRRAVRLSMLRLTGATSEPCCFPLKTVIYPPVCPRPVTALSRYRDSCQLPATSSSRTIF